MKIFLLLFFFFLQDVSGCLVVREPKCECPPIENISSLEIMKMNEESSFLGYRATTNATLTITPTCNVTLDASKAQFNDYYLMLFRYEAPPIYMRRYKNSKPIVHLTDLVCRQRDDKYQWEYGANSKITDKTLYVAIQNAGYCETCEPFKMSDDSVTMTTVNETCDIMQFNCADSENAVEIKFQAPFGAKQIVRGFYPDLTLVTAVCVDSGWQINGVKVQNPEVTCNSVYGDPTYLSYALRCPCSEPTIFESPADSDKKQFWEEFAYHYPGSGVYMDRVSTDGRLKYLIDNCTSEFVCGDTDTFVVFSMNQYPMVYPNGKRPDLRCVNPPQFQTNKSDSYWWIDNIMVAMPVYACFESIPQIDDPQIEMNGCKCPQLRYIDQEGIVDLGEQSAYLANRQVFKPKVTVSWNCEVTVDEAGLDLPDHYLMIFREEAHPIFMRRFVNGTQSSPIPLTDLVCSGWANSHANTWFYKGVELSENSLYIALQSNEGSCDCPKFTNLEDVAVEELLGTCDILQFSVNSLESLTYVIMDLDFGGIGVTDTLVMGPGNFTLTGAVCINQEWYFNGRPLPNPVFAATEREIYPANWNFVRLCHCAPPFIFQSDNEMFNSDSFSVIFDKKRMFKNRTLTDGTMEYIDNWCDIYFSCSEADDLVVFSVEHDPILFPTGDASSMRCMNPPVSQNGTLKPFTSEKYWWIHTSMMHIPYFTCFKKLEESTDIEMNGCKCPQLKYIDQDGISSLGEQSAYLANRRIFKPKVTVSGNCEVIVDEAGLDLPDHYLMIFREETHPIFMRRFLNGTQTSPIPLSDLVCRQQDDKYVWFYEENKLSENSLYIALQSNEGACDCPKFTNIRDVVAEELLGTCDILQFSVNNSDLSTVFALHYEVEDMWVIDDVYMGPGNFTLTGAVCVNQKWYYNGRALPNLDISTVNFNSDPEEWPFVKRCRCAPPLIIGKGDDWMNTDVFTLVLDKKRRFRNRTPTDGLLLYYENVCEMDFACAETDDLVVFSYERDPITFPNGLAFGMKCLSPPVSQNGTLKPFTSENSWWIDTSMINQPYLACLEKLEEPTEIEMNGCKCPQLKYVEQDGIGNLGEQSAYLANRQIFKPKVTVGENCEVMVDEAGLELPDHYLMIFREEARPVFMRRFLNGSQTSPIPLTDLLCKKQDDKYVWFYEDNKLSENSLYVALQSNEGACDCPKFTRLRNVVMEELLGTCDILQVSVNSSIEFTGIVMFIEFGDIWGIDTLKMGPGNFTMTGAVCINQQWYYNGRILSGENILAADFSGISPDSPDLIFARHCHCAMPTIFGKKDDFYREEFTVIFDKKRLFINRTQEDGTMTYIDDLCEMEYRCSNSDELVVFSAENDPIVFPSGHAPSMKCVNPPVSQNGTFKSFINERFWWIDTSMMNTPILTCLKKLEEPAEIEMNGCKCPQLKFISQEGIASRNSSAYLKDRATFRPTVTVSASCEIHVDASSIEIVDFYLMLFHDEELPIFMRRFHTGTDKASPATLSDLGCREVGDLHQWEYRGSKLTENELFIAVQSNEESCGCGELPVNAVSQLTMTFVDGTCDIFHFQCSLNNFGATIVSTPSIEQEVYRTYFSSSLSTMTCVNSKWYLNSIPLTSPVAACSNLSPGYDEDYYLYVQSCTPCTKLAELDFPPEGQDNTEFWDTFTYNYDKAGVYRNAVSKRVGVWYDSIKCTMRPICSEYDQDLVIFSMSHDPIVYRSGQTSDIQCLPPPAAQSADSIQNTEHYWWIDGKMVTNPVFTCVKRKGCPCSRIYTNIWERRLEAVEYTRYLSHRQTFEPEFSVNEFCEVMLDVSQSTVDNFFLLFIRNPETPIIFRRFTGGTSKTEQIPLTDLICAQDFDKFYWHHREVKIGETFEATLVSDEECGCEERESYYGIERTGQCNLYEYTCSNNSYLFRMEDYGSIGVDDDYGLISYHPWKVQIAEKTCVNSKVYYNGYEIDSMYSRCIIPETENPKVNIPDENCPCVEFPSFAVTESLLDPSRSYLWQLMVRKWRIEEEYLNRTSEMGTIIKFGQSCLFALNCPPGTKKIVVWSFNTKQLTFDFTDRIDVQCSPSPATTALNNIPDWQWWVNGYPMAGPFFTCYK